VRHAVKLPGDTRGPVSRAPSGSARACATGVALVGSSLGFCHGVAQMGHDWPTLEPDRTVAHERMSDIRADVVTPIYM
jgi:hypothetical protein